MTDEQSSAELAKRLIPHKEAADYLGVHPNSLHKYRANGLHAYRPAHQWLYDPLDLDQWVADSKVGG